MPVKEDILTHRKKIDNIDEELLVLLNQRAKESLAIRIIKNSNGLSVYSPKREEEIISSLIEKNNGPLYNENIRDLFLHIMKIMKDLPDDK